ncbi:hypothetical protein ACT5YR_03960 [Fructobacillus fructosus]|uniref:hypothetical protein n=1 Tax=Fructobacillus fructosus TaxID=1631 RepID=UPI0040339A56
MGSIEDSINEVAEIYDNFLSEISVIRNIKVNFFNNDFISTNQSKNLMKAMEAKRLGKTNIDDVNVKKFFDKIDVVKKDNKFLLGSSDKKVNSLMYKIENDFDQMDISKKVAESQKLTSLASLFESTLVNLVVKNVEIFDNGVCKNSSDTHISFEQLGQYDSIQELKEYALIRYLNSLTYQGVDKWVLELGKIINKKLGQKDGVISDDEKYISEFFQTRNLLVHNGGIVNNIYLQNNDPKIINQRHASIGKRIGTDNKYFSSTVEHCVNVVNQFVIEITKRILNLEELEDKLDYLEKIQSSCLTLYRNHLYNPGITIFNKLSEMAFKIDKNSNTFFMLKYNKYLSRRFTGEDLTKDDSVKKLFEYAKNEEWWDEKSESILILKIAEMSLTLSDDDFFSEATKLIKSNKDSRENVVYGGLLNMPVFSLINQNNRWSEFVDTLY